MNRGKRVEHELVQGADRIGDSVGDDAIPAAHSGLGDGRDELQEVGRGFAGGDDGLARLLGLELDEDLELVDARGQVRLELAELLAEVVDVLGDFLLTFY